MSTISASTTSTTAYKVVADTTGALVFQTGATPTTAMTLSSAQIVSFANPPVATGGGGVSSNTAYGTSALAGSNSGTGQNTAIGQQALTTNSTGANNTSVGYVSLYSNTTGTRNTATGVGALYGNTTGASNTGISINALNANTTGSYNVAVGDSALLSNTTASYNTAVGYQAGYTATANAYNVFLGYQAGYTSNYNGSGFNTCVGVQTGYSLTTGTGNTFIGGANSASGYYVTTGSNNTILGGYNGNQGGLDIRTASNYIVLSDGDGNPRLYCSNLGIWQFNQVSTQDVIRVNLGASSSGMAFSSSSAGSSTMLPFYFATTSGQAGQVSCSGNTTSYTSGSDYRLKDNIRPLQNGLALTMQMNPSEWEWKSSGDFGSGFIAHELAEICPQAVNGEKDALNEDGSIKPQGVDTSFLVGILTAAIQELKAEFDAYKATHP